MNTKKKTKQLENKEHKIRNICAFCSLLFFAQKKRVSKRNFVFFFMQTFCCLLLRNGHVQSALLSPESFRATCFLLASFKFLPLFLFLSFLAAFFSPHLFFLLQFFVFKCKAREWKRREKESKRASKWMRCATKQFESLI